MYLCITISLFLWFWSLNDSYQINPYVLDFNIQLLQCHVATTEIIVETSKHTKQLVQYGWLL